MNADRIRHDFDEIARVSDPHDEDTGRYDSFLLSLVPPGAKRVLDVGCGMGRLTAKFLIDKREVVGIDLSLENDRAGTQKGLSRPFFSLRRHSYS